MNLQKLLDKTKRKQYVDEDVLKTAHTGLKGKLEFFKIGKYISCNELKQEYEKRGLVPATIELLCKYDQDKIDEMEYVATQWQDNEGGHCYVGFSQRYGRREVRVRRSDLDWGGYWWFAGLRKSALSNSDAQKSSDTLPFELPNETIKKML